MSNIFLMALNYFVKNNRWFLNLECKSFTSVNEDTSSKHLHSMCFKLFTCWEIKARFKVDENYKNFNDQGTTFLNLRNSGLLILTKVFISNTHIFLRKYICLSCILFNIWERYFWYWKLRMTANLLSLPWKNLGVDKNGVAGLKSLRFHKEWNQWKSHITAWKWKRCSLNHSALEGTWL